MLPTTVLPKTRETSPVEGDVETVIGTCEPHDVDSGWGWVNVFAVLLINAHTWGISTSYSVFQSHYLETSTLKGASWLNFAFVGGLQYSMSFLVSPLATFLIRSFGMRTCLYVAVVVQSGSLLGASFATTIWQLILGQGVGFGAGVGLFLVCTQNVIPQWFNRRRSTANGIAAAGTGCGGLCYAFAAGSMIESIGVGWAIRVLAIISGAVNLIAALLIKDRDDEVKPSFCVFDSELFWKPHFLLLLGFGFLSMLGELVVLTQVVSFGTVQLGLNPLQASVIGAMIAIGQILGRVVIGYLSDLVGRLNIAALVTLCAGLCALIIWPLAHTYGVLIFFSIFVGCFAGAFWSIIAPMTAEIVGLQKLPVGLTMLFLIMVPPTTFSPVIALEIKQMTGSYLGVQLITGFSFIGAAACAWLLRSYQLQAHGYALTHATAPITLRGGSEPGSDMLSPSFRTLRPGLVRAIFSLRKA